MEQIEVEFQYDKQLLADAYRVGLRNTKNARWILIAIPIIVFFVFFVDVRPGISITERFADFDFLNFVAPAVFLFAIFFFMFRMPTKWANTLLKDPNFNSKIQWIFHENRIDINTPTSKAQVEWTHFKKAVFNEKFILLYQTQALMNILPTYCFTGTDLETVKALIRKNIKEVKE